MESFLIAATHKLLLIPLMLIAWPIKRAVTLYMKDGWLKRVLLRKIS